MTSPSTDETEMAIRKACELGDSGLACTRALEAYGPEILSFLAARLRTPSDADEAFSLFAEDLWKGLPGFRAECSVRGWMYTLARNAANRYVSSPHKRPERNVPISDLGPISALVERVRSTTTVYKRTDTKDRVRALRDQLAPEDQTLLILHVDRALPWREIAMVMHEDGEHLDREALDRESARLRKRFERVKAELKQLAIDAGLLPG